MFPSFGSLIGSSGGRVLDNNTHGFVLLSAQERATLGVAPNYVNNWRVCLISNVVLYSLTKQVCPLTDFV